MQQHMLYAEVKNVSGVLSHISGMFSARGYNIRSLTVGETHNPQNSRMTVVVDCDDHVMEQVRKQLEKIVTISKVVDISDKDYVERDLALIRVSTDAKSRNAVCEPDEARKPDTIREFVAIRELVEIFRAKIVDVREDSVMIELSGKEKKLEAFIELMKPFGILELARSGRIAMTRGN